MSGILLFKHNALFVHSIYIALHAAAHVHPGEFEAWMPSETEIRRLVPQDSYNALGAVPRRRRKHLPITRREIITHGGQ
jgi:hypothetical protein